MIMKPSFQLVKATLRKGGATLGNLHKSLAGDPAAKNWRGFAALAVIAVLAAGLAFEVDDKGNGMRHSVIRKDATVPILEGGVQKGERVLTVGTEVDIIDINPEKDEILVRTPNGTFEGWVDKEAITGLVADEYMGPKVSDLKTAPYWDDPTLRHFPVINVRQGLAWDQKAKLPCWQIPKVHKENTEAYLEAHYKPWEHRGESTTTPYDNLILLKQGKTKSYVRILEKYHKAQDITKWEGWIENDKLAIGDPDPTMPIYNGPIPDPDSAPMPPPERWKMEALTDQQGRAEKSDRWEGDSWAPPREFWAKGTNLLQILIKEGVAAAYERKGASLELSRKAGETVASQINKVIKDPPVTNDEFVDIWEKTIKPVGDANGLSIRPISFADATNWKDRGIKSLKGSLVDFWKEVSGYVKADQTALAVIEKSNWKLKGTYFDEDRLRNGRLEVVLLSSYDPKSQSFVCRRIDTLSGGLQQGRIKASEVESRGVAFMTFDYRLK